MADDPDYGRDVPLIPGRAPDAKLLQLHREAKASDLTYASVGITRHTDIPHDGLRIDRWSIPLDADGFERGRTALRAWRAHVGVGARVIPAHAPLAVGQTVVVAIGLPGFTAVAPCRIVWVDDEPDRFGFAYGTLRGHPERGEESFVVRRSGDAVTFEITAASRAAALLPRFGAPLTRLIQRRVTQGYLSALAEACRTVGAAGASMRRLRWIV